MSVPTLLQRFPFSDLFPKQVTLERNELLTRAGQTEDRIFFIEKGSLRIFITDGEEERIVRFGYRDNIIVALDAFLSNKPTDFYIQAIKKSVVHIASKQHFTDLIQADPAYLREWNLILEDLVLQQIEREKDLLVLSPRARYERVLLRSPQLFQEIPHKYIANYLRMTPETLSRLKKS
ncbi:MAG: Crp/Fnr family transcriptional regulator [Bacteroidetes bacterium 47-18]|mgnify:FL=1|nr:MAG: Crp/Fnr family transcriptional regulator [Bacteroidetes bacterium 47-18]